MLNHNNNTHDIVMQSQTSLNIIRVGAKIAAFLDKAQFCDDKQQLSAQELKREWIDACVQYANRPIYQKKKEQKGIDTDTVDACLEIDIDDIDNITHYLSQAKALLSIAMSNSDFVEENGAGVLFDYLSTLDDLVNNACNIINKL